MPLMAGRLVVIFFFRIEQCLGYGKKVDKRYDGLNCKRKLSLPFALVNVPNVQPFYDALLPPL